MPLFRVTVVNQTFRASHAHELSSLDDARKEGIKAALAIGIEEVTNGTPFFGAEVCISDDDGTVSRHIVSVGVSPLQ